MNEFENPLILKEELLPRRFFPAVPKHDKKGSAFILTGGIEDDIVVDKYTTTKEIRQGRYTKLIEISTLPYNKQIRFSAPGRENAFVFDIYVGGVIQVIDPILFYQNKNLDVDSYFTNLFAMDVKKITRKYSILDSVGMDEELKEKLSSYTVDQDKGFSYQISVVDATPGVEAKKYVYQFEKQKLEANMKSSARNLTEVYSADYETAVMTEVAEGKISETEASVMIHQHKREQFSEKVGEITELKEQDLITGKEAKSMASSTLLEIGTRDQPQDRFEVSDSKMKEFYEEDEE